MEVKRSYRYSDVNMLTAAATLIASAMAHAADITAKRVLWTMSFFKAIEKRITDAYPNFLGVDNAKDMRDKTKIVEAIMASAETDITTFRRQITRDFRTDKPTLNEYLTTLGFTANYKGVKKGNQKATIELLFKFDKNMTSEIISQITPNIDAALITTIRGYATTLRDANVTQENAKTMRGEITDAAVTEFNDIYGTCIDIGVICADIFKKDKTIKKEFSFSDIASRLDVHKKAATPVVKPAPTGG